MTKIQVEGRVPCWAIAMYWIGIFAMIVTAIVVNVRMKITQDNVYADWLKGRQDVFKNGTTLFGQVMIFTPDGEIDTQLTGLSSTALLADFYYLEDKLENAPDHIYEKPYVEHA